MGPMTTGFSRSRLRLAGVLIIVGMLSLTSCMKRMTTEPAVLQETVIDKKEFVAAIPGGAAHAPTSGQLPSSSITSRKDDGAIRAGDVLSIDIYEKLPASQEKRTEIKRIEDNGSLFILPVGSVPVEGLTISQIQKTIEERLRNFVVSPYCEVQVYRKSHDAVIYIFGEVGKSGSVPLQAGQTLLDALSAAGGCKDDAYRRTISVVRMNGNSVRLYTVNLIEILQSGRIEGNLVLQDQDIVFVPRRFIRNFREVLADLSSVMPWYLFLKTL